MSFTELFKIRGNNMKIVITDTGILWNPGNPILKKYRDLILVVCLEVMKATDEYECFICERSSFCRSGAGY